MASRPKVLIVGAGIIGASIAWHLVRAGALVTIVEAGAPGGIATRNSWAWINASWGSRGAYYRLRVRAMDEWRRLERELPGVRVSWVGSLLWELASDKLEAFAAEHSAWGYDIRQVDRAGARLIEPNLLDPPEFALHAPREGAVEALAVVESLLMGARDLGATIISNDPVQSIDVRNGRAVGIRTQSRSLSADEVVLAAGAGTAALAATAGLIVPMSAPPALLVRTQPHAKLLNGLIMTPTIQLRQATDGRLVAAAECLPSGDEKIAAAGVFDEIRGLFHSARLEFDTHLVSPRPIPQDGFPAVGRSDSVDGLYIAVTHSGITLAPAIGCFVADEIVAGLRSPLLEPFGLERLVTAKEN